MIYRKVTFIVVDFWIFPFKYKRFSIVARQLAANRLRREGDPLARHRLPKNS